MLEAPAISPLAFFLLIVSDTTLAKTAFLKKSCRALRFSLSSSGSRKMGSGKSCLSTKPVRGGHSMQRPFPKSAVGL